MPTPYILTEEDQRDMDYIYRMMTEYPFPSSPGNKTCQIQGHKKVWVRLDKSMRLRREYSNGPTCERCSVQL